MLLTIEKEVSIIFGILDSGAGGLLAAKKLHEICPCADIIYYGDSANMPYGSKSSEEIIKLSKKSAEHLVSQGADAILIACGTVSSVALTELRSLYNIPFFGVIEKAAQTAAEKTKTGRIGIISTPATMKSGAFKNSIKALGKDCIIEEASSDKLAEMLERKKATLSEITNEIAYCTKNLREAQIDTLILGCTHFPLAIEEFKKALPGVSLIDSGACAAEEIAQSTGAYKAEKEQKAKNIEGKLIIQTSGEAQIFQTIADELFGKDKLIVTKLCL